MYCVYCLICIIGSTQKSSRKTETAVALGCGDTEVPGNVVGRPALTADSRGFSPYP
jgi:hypothetical protein